MPRLNFWPFALAKTGCEPIMSLPSNGEPSKTEDNLQEVWRHFRHSQINGLPPHFRGTLPSVDIDENAARWWIEVSKKSLDRIGN